jgi:hypothetical protein
MYARDRSSSLSLAEHYRRIEFVPAVVGENGSFTGVEKRRIFKHPDRDLDRVNARSAGLQSLVSRENSLANLSLNSFSFSGVSDPFVITPAPP